MGCLIRLYIAVLLGSALITLILVPKLRPNLHVISTLYAQKTLEKTTDEFPNQWCRLQKWRVDWERMLSPCVEKMSWDLRDVTSPDRTSAVHSYITKWLLSPAGGFSRFLIQSVNVQGRPKTFGGDSWRIRIRQGPSSLAPVVFDLENGLYEVLFMVLEPGNYSVEIFLDHTLCDGFRDPPQKFFKYGTDYGTYNNIDQSFLGYIGQDYINKPLQGRTNLQFTISSLQEKIGLFKHCEIFESGECKKLDFSCNTKCNLMWDGHGRWFQNFTWKPYLRGPKVTYTNSATPQALHVLGDSNARRFMQLARTRDLCKIVFRKCILTTNWVYKYVEGGHRFNSSDEFDQNIVLKQLSVLLGSKEMNTNGSVFLFNMGLHYSLAVNFSAYQTLIDSVIQLLQEKESDGVTSRYKSVHIWRGTTMLEREKLSRTPWPNKPYNSTLFRFHTNQRTKLFHTYAMQSMCRAGIPVIDVFPLSGSYPRGSYDNVHYDLNVFIPVTNLLERYFQLGK